MLVAMQCLIQASAPAPAHGNGFGRAGVQAEHPTAGLRSVSVMWFASLLTVVLAAIAPASGLRPLAEAAEFELGAAIDVDALTDDAYRQLLVDNVTMASTSDDLSFAVVQPTPGTFDFARTDALVDFAVANDMTVRGHDLIGVGALPAWITDGVWTAETLGEVLRGHVTEVVSHYRDRNPGVVTQWDVVGEAFLADGSPRPTIWQQVIGDDYLRIAFDAARAADPDALLFYDDFYDDLAVSQDAVETGTPITGGAMGARSNCADIPKCVAVQTAVSTLVAAGVPIDGIGLQAHMASPDPVDFTTFSSWVGDLGLVWAVTEYDVPLPITEVTNPVFLEFQAATYGDALGACVQSPICDTFVTWGITDRYWQGDAGEGFGGALWFDDQDAPKSAFAAMAEVLDAASVALPTTLPPTTSTLPPTTTVVDADTAATGSDSNSTVIAVVVGAAALGGIALIIAALRRPRRERTPEQE